MYVGVMNDEPILLVLDLDETLIYASIEELSYPYDYRDTFYDYYKRPHLDDFLFRMAKSFRMAIWSSGGTAYVHRAAEMSCAWSRSPRK